MSFSDRHDAGRALAQALHGYAGRSDAIVLALPRGGVPVAFEVATRLHLPLDVFVVRKLGVPGHEELAMGAIASGGVATVNPDVLAMLDLDAGALQAAVAREQVELERRERAYRGDREPHEFARRTVIVIDDGLATGATMRAALTALRQMQPAPAKIVAAVPVAATDACGALRAVADEVVCLHTPEPFGSVGQWYDDFDQTSDAQVRELLARARPPAANPADEATSVVQRRAVPLQGSPADFDALLERAANARLVLLGEASHGTHEFYQLRADITRRLVTELGFTAIAVEGDWPDAYRVNRFVRGDARDADADHALSGFLRFPTWLWRNTVVRGFVEWLRAHNAALAPQARVGFYGLDLYSLHRSIQAVLDYLHRTDPEAARRARERYACFDHFGDDPQAYGHAASLDLAHSCEDEVVAQLLELRRDAQADGEGDDEDRFHAEQNARLVANAEAYYRSMFRGRQSSWNLRDTHMMETLQALLVRGAPGDGGARAARIVVWAHNSHLGDARATQMGGQGELNLGQLVRQRHPDDCLLVGFSTYRGTVTAAHDWDEPAQRRNVRAGLPGSYEALFHGTGLPAFQLDLRDPALRQALAGPRLQRAIGVIYRPQTERYSHYFETRLPAQFDWMLHLDETRALEPLDPGAWAPGDEPPETWPSGL
jgi:erythromycin esterase-like protein/predicted phosphoribosyltransferase